MSVSEILTRIFNQKTDQLVNQYSVAIVDLPNFLDYDSLSLLKNLHNYTSRIIFVCDLKNPHVDVKLKRMQSTLCKYSVFIAPTDAVDTTMVSLANELSRNCYFTTRGKVLVATTDTGIIKAIASSLNGQKVGFFIHDDIDTMIPVKGYEIIRRTLVTFEEGLIKRILRIAQDSTIKQAKGSKPKEEFKTRVLELAPVTLGELYDQLQKENIVKDKEHFLKGIAYMAINKQIWLKNHPDDVNLVTVQTKYTEPDSNSQSPHA
jgi:hypothetical protein